MRILGPLGEPARERLERALADARLPVEAQAKDELRFERVDAAAGPEAYTLTVGPAGAVARASSDRGLDHAASTLAQWIAGSPRGETPGVEIVDRPSLERRGVMLDVSRERVPTMDTLFELVELFAGWKVNELQLYTEHTFAYAGHEEVWREASPLTPAEVRRLDAFCRERHVALVPNQNCFGHLHRWLKLPRYQPLAEVPGGVQHPFATEPEPFSLCPGDPRSLELVADLLDQLLPCFASDEVNVGLDETFDLGQGRSAQAVAQRGVGRVYLDFLLAVEGLVRERGHRMQFWADILLNHPELVDELPPEVVPLVWGYEADHPFERQLPAVAAGGRPFVVCPGTASWQSFGGRTETMAVNIERAAQLGAQAGARGLLVTDWGDRGHLQPLPVSLAGWAHAADRAWNPEPAAPADLESTLDRLAFGDAAGGTAQAALELGRVEERVRSGAGNGGAAFFLVAMMDEPLTGSRMPDLSLAGIERGLDQVARAREPLAGARPTHLGADLVREEFTLVADLLAFGLELGRARLEADPDRPPGGPDALGPGPAGRNPGGADRRTPPAVAPALAARWTRRLQPLAGARARSVEPTVIAF